MAKSYRIDNIDDQMFVDADTYTRKMIVTYGCIMMSTLVDRNPIMMSKQSLQNEAYEQKCKELKNFYDTLNNERLDRMNELTVLNKTLINENDRLKNKYECNNTKKGQDGEKSIYDFISNTFTDCELSDTAKTTGAGDLHLYIQNLNILIESKNKGVITKEDVNKFKRDLTDTESNAGIIVSIRDIPFPLKGNFGFEIYNEIPIFYISNFENVPELLKLGIQMCISICKKINMKPTELEEKFKSVICTCNILIPMIKSCKNSQEKALKEIKQVLKTIEEQLEQVDI